MLERDYSDNVDAAARTRADGDCKVLECSLPPPVQALLKTICSIAMMKSAMADIGAPSSHTPQPAAPRHHPSLAIMSNHVSAGYDSVKCPLGKLSHSVIMHGMAVLRQIEAKISSNAGASLADLSSQFYTFIPHVSGMSAPPTIRDLQAVASKVELLMCLLDVTVAVRKMEASEQAVVHPLDHVYSSLSCSIQPLESGSTLNMIRDYLVTRPHSFTVFFRPRFKTVFCFNQLTTHGQTHSEWRLELQAAYSISRLEEEARFEPHKLDCNRRLLWFQPPPPLPP